MIAATVKSNLSLVGAALFATLAVVVFGFAVAWRQADQDRIDALARSTNNALCTFRSDFERRVSDTEAFLAEHPNGIAGISGNDLQRSLDGQRSTLRALSDLEC